MAEDRDPEAVRVFGQCLLCEDAANPPVALCQCCGAFVCRKHTVQVVYRPPRRPVGMVVPRTARENRTRLEIVCEVCHLNRLVEPEEAV